MPDLDGLEANVYFENEGDEVLGRLEVVDLVETADRRKVYRLGLRTSSGILRWVTAYQAHLQARLADWAPQTGETIWIRYVGDDKRAPRGLNPTKRFRVKVDRSQSPAATPNGPILGEVVAPEKESPQGVEQKGKV